MLGGRLVLGLETGGEHLSVALLSASPGEAPRLVGEVRAHRGSRHIDLMLGLIADLLARHELTPAALSLVAVSRGPGGFTGVRLGLSLAQGLGLAAAVPIWPVSSLAALALNAVVPGTLVLALIDARKGEVYAGCYRLRANAPPLTLLAPRAGTCESAVAAAREAAEAAGVIDEVGRMVVLGSGALAYGVASPLAASAHVASAAAVAELALAEWAQAGFDAAAGPPVDAAYLRRSEAEVMADERAARAREP